MKKIFSFSLDEKDKKFFKILAGNTSFIFFVVSWALIFTIIVGPCLFESVRFFTQGEFNLVELRNLIWLVVRLWLVFFCAVFFVGYSVSKVERKSKSDLEHAENSIRFFYYSPFLLPFYYLRRCLKNRRCLC